jgi:hypothetical protein
MAADFLSFILLQIRMPNQIQCNGHLRERVGALDFLDLGGSTGGSFAFMCKQFGYTRGLNVDLDPGKVAKALAKGIPTLQLDATNLAIFTDRCCSTVSMLHFLEHLPDMDHVERVLREAVRVANERLFIRGPPFHDKYLGARGVRYYWAHWVGHSVHVEAEDIIRILNKLGVHDITCTHRAPVRSTNDPCIQSIECAIDRHQFDPTIDPPKPVDVPLENVYREFEIIAIVPESRPVLHDDRI